MRFKNLNATLKTAILVTTVLLLGAGLSIAQVTVGLTAGPSTATLPDGSAVPMWGYSCTGGPTANCRALNGSTSPAVWSPVVITVPTGQDLTISLTNSLSFASGNSVPTSLTIVGQLGGGLDTANPTRGTTPAPDHSSAQSVTWPTVDSTTVGTPPTQGPRVQSFSTEVAAGATTSLTWTAPRAGTYLLESGTHPSIQGPMGLYGMVVVTSTPTTALLPFTAYPGVTYNADVKLLLSEIDPVQNNAVQTAVNTVGFSETKVWSGLYSSPITAITMTDPGSGYTTAPNVSISAASAAGRRATATASVSSGHVTVNLVDPGTGYTSPPIVTIDPPPGTGTQALATTTITLGPGCGQAHTCYPPAVNYTPLYYLFNGVAFNKTNAAASLFPTFPASIPAPAGKTVLVRLVNAGLRMHVPSIVGSQTGASVGGFSLIAEDGNPLPGVPRVQSEVFMAAGKTYDVMINAPATVGTALPIFDRELSLSGNAISRDAGMLAYIGINGAGLPGAAALGAAAAVADTYNSVIAGQTLIVSDPAKGVIANDFNIYGVHAVPGSVTGGTLTLNANGTFTFAATSASGGFRYCGNGVADATPSPAACANVTLGAAKIETGGIHCSPSSFTSALATYINIPAPGVLAYCKDDAGYPLKVDVTQVKKLTGTMEPNGGFIATPGSATFTFQAQNSQGTNSGDVTVTLNFPTAGGPAVTLVDGQTRTALGSPQDYRWIIEEDRTFYVNPTCAANPLPGGCPTATTGGTGPAVFGTNFHTSNMPMIATGCTGPLSCELGQTVLDPATGIHSSAVCDAGNGICRPDTTNSGQVPVDPGKVGLCTVTQTTNCLDKTKRYYISVLPGDAGTPFAAGNASACLPNTDPKYDATQCGHTMGGAPFAWNGTAWANPGVAAVVADGSLNVIVEPTPLTTAKLSVFVFEDDFPLNGEQDGGGGIDVLSPNEPGLGGFQITLFDDAGGTGDATGQPTYDMFNMPLSNALAGTIDPSTGMDACPVSTNARTAIDTSTGLPGGSSPTGITGMIVTCPKYESDNKTLSPLAGQAVVANLYPGRYGVVATPAADRIGRGEEWLQTNTLDGQKAHDSFMRVGEPGYFQEFGPASFHVTIGFANPAIINSRKQAVCDASTAAIPSNPCNHAVTGIVTTARNSRTPDERIYGSGSRDSFAFTQCYVSLGDPDGEDYAFTKCNPDGTFKISNIPSGDWRVVIFDQWNDQIVDGISTPVRVGTSDIDMGEIGANQWQANIYTRSYFDQDGNGIPNRDYTGTQCPPVPPATTCNPNYGNDLEAGLALVATNIRFRDGSYSNFNNTDLNGYAGFNEVFPLFSWYVIETDATRYKSTGTHVVYDAGGPADGSGICGQTGVDPCGSSTIAQNYARTYDNNPLPGDLSVPGAVYCAEGADCLTSAASFAAGTPILSSADTHSTGRIDPPWATSYGWQGFSGQNSFLDFGKKPFTAGETGGIYGLVVYYSTRPFDDPALDLQLSWTPLVPHVTVNLYQDGTDPNTGAQTLKLVDTTQTSSWDDWAQGFYPNYTDPTTGNHKPYMNCPGQTTTDPFYYSLLDQPNYLDWYNNQHGGPTVTPLPYHSQYKCYDGMHMWNQLQPAPYDGRYQFPSITGRNPMTGNTTGTNCTICGKNADSTDKFRFGKEDVLPAGKYVVEVVVPPGYELVKEEDKNILIGDNYIAPVTQEFAGLGNVFILPDQAAIASQYNPYNQQNSTTNMGTPRHEGDTGSVEMFWPCVGQARVVPDYLSLFPQAQEVSPFAGATRNLCDRKEITLEDQSAALAKFFLFTSNHAASHYTGVITDDFSSEFDPFSPQFGEKFAPAYLPVSVKDFRGNEIARTYADEFGTYNGLNYSTWEVNPPNPTGYAPTMMVVCMNDSGAGATPDPKFQAGYSQFCYELPFMPGQTGYFDTPVVPTSAFSEGYNHPDCSYPDRTPAIASVVNTNAETAGAATLAAGSGPWVSGSGGNHKLTITALGLAVPVDSYAYTGPSVTTPPFNAQKVNRYYGFGTTAGTVALVGSDGVSRSLTSVTWGESTITGTVPSGLPNCPGPAQQQQFGGPTGNNVAKCGELVITAANGKRSIDTVTVTVGGKTPTLLPAGHTIQSAIDAAMPGDMIIVPQNEYNELLLMWKPVRLQGVGAASSVINANTHPAGELKLDPWRHQVVCLFGLGVDGSPSSWDPACGSSWTQFNATTTKPQVDRLPLQATVGWDAGLNGNLAEQLQEPTLMGAYEGAAITVLAKGVDFHGLNPWTSPAIAETGAFPTGTTLLDGSNKNCGSGNGNNKNPFPSSFFCNPSSIDGLGLINSSQGGGGIFVHGWGHNIQIANNRIHNNNGTLSGGITIGQGEHPGAFLAGDVATTVPGSCQSSNVANLQLPYCFDMFVNVHHNNVSLNSSTGDELFSATPAGAGGVSFCSGSDNYQFKYNWVCGNLSTGDAGGIGHLGFSYSADIENNSILFNESTNPTISTNGGGLFVYSAPDVDPTCGQTNDKDCAAPGVGDGAGPNMKINANLFLGNAAESGSGGGIRFQSANGAEIGFFPNGNSTVTFPTITGARSPWYTVTVTNNIITNNVAGWDGGGVSLLDSLAVNFINNTVVSNDSTASAGVLFNSLFSGLASASGPPPSVDCSAGGQFSATGSCPQVAGVVSVPNSAAMTASFTGSITCPIGHGTGGTGTGGRTNGACRRFSFPVLYNDLLWQNRSFYISVGNPGTGTQNQQNTVALYNASFTSAAGTAAASQASTGQCVSGSKYWDIGVRGDTGPSNHRGSTNSTPLTPTYSAITDVADYSAAALHNTGSNPAFVSQYCNGSRVPPELGNMGYTVNPGTNENNFPNPIFSLTPSATVDEGNNWINMRWGPLSLTHPVSGAVLGDYRLAAGSLAIDAIPPGTPTYAVAPSTDFFGNPRPDAAGTAIDIGAVETPNSPEQAPPPTLTSISPTSGVRGTVVAVTITGTNLATAAAVNVSGTGVTAVITGTPTATTVTATFTIATGATLGAHNVTVSTLGGISNARTFTVVNPPPPTLSTISPTSGTHNTTVAVTLTGTNLTGATAVNISGNTGNPANRVSVNSIVVNGTGTSLTANFVIPNGAARTARTITVTALGGTSNGVTFTVN